MCGIAGILKFADGVRVEADHLEQMCRVMTHRGPDDQGTYLDGRVGLGMRRLSIVDLATGHQPISNEDGTIWIVFNGEIYNQLALRDQLILRGHSFRTHSDTETIVHLYEEYGRDCVQHLRGMFAFAIWDKRRHCLFIARDSFGIKPLYYYHGPDFFLFGSEIKVLLTYPGCSPEFFRACLSEYLAFGYLSGKQTFYKNVNKLLPGCWMEIEEHGKCHTEAYWDLPDANCEPARDEGYYVSTYRSLLEDAVESHLMSDVPLGVFLSGGLDSSVVAALTTKLRRAPVETFSVGYSEQKHSELSYARIVAQHLGSMHSEVLVREQDFFESLPGLIWHEDEPIAWPSSVALFFVARLAAERVKVVLTGEGSDETLAGYTRYAFTLKNTGLDRSYRRLMPAALRRSIREFISNSGVLSANLSRKVSHSFLARDGASWESIYFDNFFSAFSEEEQSRLFHHDAAREFEHGSAYQHVVQYWQNSSGDTLYRLLYTDIKTYLVELLMKQDNMSMAASIESRVPFLDRPLAEFSMKIPKNVLIKGMSGKAVLKKSVEDLLPRSIIYREKKGFPTPWSEWLGGPRLNHIQDLLCEARSVDRGLFDINAVKKILHEHRVGHRDHSDRIWRLLNLELWHRVCLEGDSKRNLTELAEVKLASPVW